MMNRLIGIFALMVAIWSPVVAAADTKNTRSCEEVAQLLGRPDDLVKIASLSRVVDCTGMAPVWVAPYVFNNVFVPAHHELHQVRKPDQK